jgi:hypothetical protein
MADFSGTGRGDILLRATSGAVTLMSLNGSGVTLPPYTGAPDDQNASCTSTSLTVSTSFIGLPSVDPSWQFFGSGDLNGDGVVDVVWMQPSGTLTVWLMQKNNLSPQVIANAGTAPAGYTVFQNGGPSITTTGPVPNVPFAYAQSARLLGSWRFAYSISTSAFTNNFSLTSMDNAPNSSGDYYATGRDEFSRIVVGAYSTSSRNFNVLIGGTIIDMFFVFSFTGNDNVAGCYYQISPPRSTNLSRCYDMTGFRTAAARVSALKRAAEEEQRMRGEAAASETELPPEVLEAYQRLSSKLREAR